MSLELDRLDLYTSKITISLPSIKLNYYALSLSHHLLLLPSIYLPSPSLSLPDHLYYVVPSISLSLSLGYAYMSSHSVSAPLPEAATSVGLGYGIAIAVGILVLVSTIMLASYVCVRVKGGRHLHPTSTPASVSVSVSLSAAAAASSDSPSVLVVTGLDGPTIDSYPKFIYGGAQRPDDDDGSSTACPICLSEYRAEETVRLMPECRHWFHAACVDEWLRMSATCPLCRNSPAPTPLATPLSELIPLALHARTRR
ncbi:hypothetical protein ACLOJK_024775 [Asimina triloba]